YIYSYNSASGGAKELSAALGAKRIKHEGSKFRGSPSKTVINWGSSKVSSEVAKCRVLNPPEKVAICSNKLAFFRYLAHEAIDPPTVPKWTQKMGEALSWVQSGSIAVARTILSGHSAQGLVLIEKEE